MNFHFRVLSQAETVNRERKRPARPESSVEWRPEALCAPLDRHYQVRREFALASDGATQFRC